MPPKKKYELKEGAIVLEPHSEFKNCILRINKDGHYVYSRTRLVKMFVSQGMSITDAQDWVDYNIFSLAPMGLAVSQR
jgi:hypothetical protein